MKYFVIPALAVAAVSVALLRRLVLRPRPELPPLSPLNIRPDDPLMKEAVARAKESLPLFRELAAGPHRSRRVKVPVITNTGVKEYLWADVLAFSPSGVKIRYLMPPASAKGRFERVATCSLADLADLVDWQIELPTGQYRGGFTLRVLFLRAREQWGTLPPELATQELRHRANIQWSPAAYLEAKSVKLLAHEPCEPMEVSA